MSISAWVNVGGTAFANPELSKKLRVVSEKRCKLSALVQPSEDLNIGKKAGESVAIRLMGRITDSGATALGEFTPVPFSKIPEYYLTATVARYARAVAWTGTMQDLDRMDVKHKTIEALSEHYSRTVNALVYAQLLAGRSFCYRPTGAAAGTFNTDGTSAGAPGAVMSLWHLQNVNRQLSKNNVPYADGSNYLCAASPTFLANIIMDTAAGGFTDVKKYAAGGVEGVLKNEIGSVAGIRFFEDNDQLNALEGTYGNAFLTGYDAIREVPVYPMHLRYNGDVGGDFANQQAICWQMCGAYKAIWNHTAHGQGGICHFADA